MPPLKPRVGPAQPPLGGILLGCMKRASCRAAKRRQVETALVQQGVSTRGTGGHWRGSRRILKWENARYQM